MAVGFVASATSGSQASVASFNIGTLGTGARAGIVFIATHGTGDLITGVTWNGVAMNRLYRAADTDTEPGAVVAYFLDNVSNGTITVSRTNNAVVTVGYAASISAARVTRAIQTITRVSSTQNTDADTSTTGTGASGEVAVDDGSPGTSSMRFAAAYTGAATPVAQGTNSTALQSLDSTAFGSSFVRETTAGQGSRSVGFATGTTDDWALVAVAVREEPALNPQPSAAALVLTGDTPIVTVPDPKVSVPTAASLTLTGSTPTVTVTANATSLPTSASLTLTGSTPAVSAGGSQSRQPTAGSLTLAGDTPTVTATDNQTSQPTAASLTLTGSVPDVAAGVSDNKTALPSAAGLTLTGSTPTVAATDHKTALPDLVELVVVGATPTVTTTSNVYIVPGPLELTLAGATPTITGGAAQSIPSWGGGNNINPNLVHQNYVGPPTPVFVFPRPAFTAFAMASPSVTVSPSQSLALLALGVL